MLWWNDVGIHPITPFNQSDTICHRHWPITRARHQGGTWPRPLIPDQGEQWTFLINGNKIPCVQRQDAGLILKLQLKTIIYKSFPFSFCKKVSSKQPRCYSVSTVNFLGISMQMIPPTYANLKQNYARNVTVTSEEGGFGKKEEGLNQNVHKTLQILSSPFGCRIYVTWNVLMKTSMSETFVLICRRNCDIISQNVLLAARAIFCARQYFVMADI